MQWSGQKGRLASSGPVCGLDTIAVAAFGITDFP